MKRIIAHYHGKPIWMDQQLANALNSYKAYRAGTDVTKRDVLECCLTGNHFRALHLTKAQKSQIKKNAVNALMNAHILSFPGGDFEALYDDVEKAIGGINQIGLLVLYDTTKMIGHVLGIEPVNYVYTQSGAKIGAKKLLGMKRMGKRVPTSAFAKLFPGEKSIYIEDMLCIYKKYFRNGGANNKAATLVVPSVNTGGCGSKPQHPSSSKCCP